MLDSFGREVHALRLAVTEACDLRCRYCVPQNGVSSRGEPLTADELVAFAQAAAACGINKIRLTGGEPLLRADLLDICERIARMEGIRSLCLTTNGTRLAKLALPLRKAGLQRVNLSLDTLKNDLYHDITRGGTLSDALDGLHAALLAGFARVKINCVLMGGINDDEIADFVELAQKETLDVRFIELMPMGECAGWPSERFISAEEVLKRCPPLQPSPSEGVANRDQNPGAKGTVGLIRPMSHTFCGDCDRIRITADGMLKPCLHSATEIPLRGLSGDALVARMAEGIGCKPPAHHLQDSGTETTRRMNQIGG